MKLIFIIGSHSVGKMTVGQELEKVTGLQLFHNHVFIEPVLKYFNNFPNRLIIEMRECFFHEFAQTDEEGLIITYVCDFDNPEEVYYIDDIVDIFREYNNEVTYGVVELVAPLDIRLQRNKTENRLKYKESKRDIVTSEQRIINSEVKHRLESEYGEMARHQNYMKIYNKNISAKDAAQLIKNQFSFL